jgi:hypothetical protein
MELQLKFAREDVTASSFQLTPYGTVLLAALFAVL